MALTSCIQIPHDVKLKFQWKLNTVLVKFIGNQKMTPETEKLLLDFEDYNLKNQDVFINQQTMMHQLYLFIGKKLVHHGDVAKGIFILSKTNRVLGTIGYWSVKDFYEELLEHAKPKDYDEILAILTTQKKSTFQTFLTNKKTLIRKELEEDFTEDQWTYDTAQINKNKILDFKSMYYIRRDELDSALLCINQIPETYWNEWPYQLFKCFPFTVHSGTDYQSNNDFFTYNKRKFLQRMCNIKYLIKII